MNSKIKKQLDRLYLAPGRGFVGINKLFFLAKEKKLKVSRKQIKEYLKGQDAYTLHRFAKTKNFKRARVVSYGIFDCWQGDLMVGIKPGSNDFKRFLFLCVDVFSYKIYGGCIRFGIIFIILFCCVCSTTFGQ